MNAFSASEVIRKRSSKRTYEGIPLSTKEKEEILGFMESGNRIFPASVRMGFVEVEKDGALKLGTYGVIKNGKSFLAAAIKEEPNNMEELGYRMERGVLYATSLGLGSCWLGGSFRREDFGKAMGILPEESIPAVCVMGSAPEKRRLLDRTMRGIVGSEGRKPWEELFFSESFSTPLKKEEAGVFSEPLEMVRLGPSAANRQPWRVLKSGDTFHFYLSHTKNYSATWQRMDLGIAACHFEMAAEEKGISGAFRFSEPELKKPEGVDYIFSWEKL